MFTVIVYLLSATLALLAYLSYVSLTSKPKNFPPGPPAVPIIGSFQHISPNSYVRIQELAKNYGNIFHVNLFTTNVIILSGYELIKYVLKDKGPQFSDRVATGTFTVIREVDGIASAPYGPKWAAQRKVFHSAMRKMGLTKRSIAKRILEELVYVEEKLRAFCDSEKPNNPGHIFDFASLNVVSFISMGDRFDYDDAQFQKLIALNQVVFKNFNNANDKFAFLYVVWPGLGKIWHSPNIKKVKHIYDTFKQFFKQEIKNHRQTIDYNAPRDFIDHYLIEMETDNVNNYLTDKSLEYSIIDLFQAGTETTASTLKWAILYMVNYPEVQEKVHKEIASVIGHGQFSYDDKLKLPYCEATILEVQRKATIAPLGINHSPVEDETIAGYDIPKETMILASYHSVHYSAEHWKNPTEFDPENFLDSDGKVGTREAFFPFGGGRRICIGIEIARMELFIFFVGIMQKFKFSLPKEKPKLDEYAPHGVTLVPSPYQVIIESL